MMLHQAIHPSSTSMWHSISRNNYNLSQIANSSLHTQRNGISCLKLVPQYHKILTLRTIRTQARTSKKDDNDPPTYNDALFSREQQLWDRQAQMMDSIAKESQQLYNSLMQTHLLMQEQHTAERNAWNQREESLQRENSELRAQLLYALSKIKNGMDLASKEPTPSQDTILDGRAAVGGLPSPGGYQVRAAMQAVRDTASDQQQQPLTPTNTPPPPSPAVNAAAPASNQPGWASDIAAAIAAVDHVDILKENVDFKSTSAASLHDAPPPTSTSTPPPATPPNDNQRGPPPPLSIGSEDIFWVNQLHTALVDEGFYPGDEDIDDFYFGESTQSALMTFQACNSIAETGATDDATWLALLGPSLELKQSRDLTDDDQLNSQDGTSNDENASNEKPYAEFFQSTKIESGIIDEKGDMHAVDSIQSVHDTSLYTDGRVVDDEVVISQHVESTSPGNATVTTEISSTHTVNRTQWPTLIDGDGGRDVHSLHVALSNAGYSACEDDIRWWQFGDSTINALKTFQACTGLPESGVCDARTWLALLGDDATPNDLSNLKSGESDDEDLDISGGRVWLMGEQRWEDRRKLQTD